MNKKSNLRLPDLRGLVATCVHEAGHAVYDLHDLKRTTVITKIDIFGVMCACVTIRDRRRIEAREVQWAEYPWRCCAMYLAGVAAESSFFSSQELLLRHPHPSLVRSIDWKGARRAARFLEAKSAEDALWGVCPWPKNELVPNGGRLLRALCGDKNFANLGKKKQRIIRLAWRRALWVVRRRDKAIVRLTDELLKKGNLGGKRANNIFNETR